MKLIKLLLVFIFTATAVKAQINVPASNILAYIMTSEKDVDLNEYNHFWRQVGATNQQDRRFLLKKTKKMFISIVIFNQYIWNCAEQSWLSGKKNNCEEATAIIADLKTYTTNTEDINLINSLQQKLDQILQASATKTNMVASNGQGIKIDLNEIKLAQKLAQKVVKRANLLLQEDFIKTY
jgi:hypothetical protein